MAQPKLVRNIAKRFYATWEIMKFGDVAANHYLKNDYTDVFL